MRSEWCLMLPISCKVWQSRPDWGHHNTPMSALNMFHYPLDELISESLCFTETGLATMSIGIQHIAQVLRKWDAWAKMEDLRVWVWNDNIALDYIRVEKGLKLVLNLRQGSGIVGKNNYISACGRRFSLYNISRTFPENWTHGTAIVISYQCHIIMHISDIKLLCFKNMIIYGSMTYNDHWCIVSNNINNCCKLKTKYTYFCCWNINLWYSMRDIYIFLNIYISC